MSEESTPPDLVELTRHAIESGARGDVDATLSHYTSESVWDMSRVGLGEYTGFESIRRFVTDWVDLYEELRVDVREILDLGRCVTWAVAHMSQENVRRICEVSQASTPASSPMSFLQSSPRPTSASRTPRQPVTDQTYHGAQGLREWRSDFFEAFGDETCYENVEVIAHGDDFVVSLVRLIGQGARSGAPLELRWVVVTWFEGSEMSRAVGYLNRREGLAAVGLAE
jgi:hypothetical protein